MENRAEELKKLIRIQNIKHRYREMENVKGNERI